MFKQNDQIISRSSKDAHFEEWLKALTDYSNYLSKKDVKVIISTPIPEFPTARYKMCKGQNTQWFNVLGKKDCSYPLDFFGPKNGHYSYIIQRLEEISKANDNIFLFDALTIMCPYSKCNVSRENNLLFRDHTHISNYAARYIIAPEIINFIKKENIISKE